MDNKKDKPRKIGDVVFGRALLFHLADGSEVLKGDILYHPNQERYPWYLKAEFKSNLCGTTVTMRAYNGAVPTVNVADLLREPPEVKWLRCRTCGQFLPPK